MGSRLLVEGRRVKWHILRASRQSWPCNCAARQRCSHFAARAGMPSAHSRHALRHVCATPRTASTRARRLTSADAVSIHAVRALPAATSRAHHSWLSRLSKCVCCCRSPRCASQSGAGTWHAITLRRASVLISCLYSSLIRKFSFPYSGAGCAPAPV